MRADRPRPQRQNYFNLAHRDKRRRIPPAALRLGTERASGSGGHPPLRDTPIPLRYPAILRDTDFKASRNGVFHP